MKNQRKRRKLFKRLISGVSALALSVGLLASIPASADDSNAGYKYTLFAYSSEEGAISSSAANFCVNGNIATNGTISAGQNFNINGEKKEHANEAMPDLSKAINEKFFAENVDVKAENYKNEDVNINVLAPLDVKGKAEFKGNIKLAAGVKAMGDITLSGGVLNNDSTVLFSENGSININSENVSLTGLVYAPKGNIVIESKSLNLNSVVMIANKITLNAPNVNINSNAEMAKFVQEAIDKNGSSGGNEDPEPVTDRVIYAYGEYNEETKSVDIEWYSNVTGEFAVLESLNGTDYTVVSKVSNDTKYSIKVTSDFIKKYFKVSTIKDGKTIESIPFSIVNANGKYSTELLDTDKDGLADLYEEMLGTDKTLPDTDKDGLTDYEEVYITNTDPTKYDSVTEGISDADADNDKDGLTNKREIELKTDSNSDDTDGDNLKDGDELSKYNTDPTKRDTDGDELEDDDEFKFNCNPNKKDTDNNGIIDGKEKHKQTVDVVPDNKEQAVTKVSVSMSASGNIEKTTTVESIMDKDVLCSNVVGLVGEPFSIESKSSFEKATITFTVDKTKLGETEFDNLMFLWYDRENDNFVELETSHDSVNSTVSTEITHFSEYMIVDSDKWFRNWEQIEKDRQAHEKTNNESASVTTVIFRCSDAGDPDFINPDENSSTLYTITNYRKLICEHLISNMSESDLLGFEHYDYTSNKTKLRSNATNSIKNDVYEDMEPKNITFPLYFSSFDIMVDFDTMDKKRIIFITDRDLYMVKDDEFGSSSFFSKHYKEVPVDFVCVGEFAKTDLDNTNLKKIADETKGKVYSAITLNEFYTDSRFSYVSKGLIDTDEDGFTDEEEIYGLVVDSSGTRYKTDPKEKDTDKDDLKDNEEVDVNRINVETKDNKGNTVWKSYHRMRSDPTKQDSDGDGINDKYDEYPLSGKLAFLEKLKELEKTIDEFWETEEAENLLFDDNIEYNYNSIITMNMLRSIAYGPGEGEREAMKWSVVGGDSYGIIQSYIDSKKPDVLKFFQAYGEKNTKTFKDADGHSIELLHMLATLSGQYNTSFFGKNILKIDKELSGWAGDLQTFIYDVKVNTYVTDSTPKKVAVDMIAKEKTYFSLYDMLSDIDAENIYRIYSPKLYLSEMLEDYYNKNQYYKKRYSLFVDLNGGLDSLKRKVDKFTRGNGFIRHKLLNEKAQEAAINEKVVNKVGLNNFDFSFITEFSKITEEESDALTYAFINHIRERSEIESNE